MTKERIEEVRDKYLYICDNVATKYNLDEDGKQDLVLYYLELCQNKPDLVRKGSYRLYGYLYSRAERILRRREREAVRECSIEECELYDDSISQVEDKVWGESLSEEIEQLLPTLAAPGSRSPTCGYNGRGDSGRVWTGTWAHKGTHPSNRGESPSQVTAS